LKYKIEIKNGNFNISNKVTNLINDMTVHVFYISRDLAVVGASFGSSQPSLSAGVLDCPIVHRTLQSVTVNRCMIGHCSFQAGTGLSGAPFDR
jgi:hypothetical protein